MIKQIALAGSFTLPGTSMTANRMGYGAMQLAGRDGDKLVSGPHRDVDGAAVLLREVIASAESYYLLNGPPPFPTRSTLVPDNI